jgi:AcrR family transcriptional regulator
MRRVADELGTGAASLYWHVADKDELLDLIFDRVIGEHDLPDRLAVTATHLLMIVVNGFAVEEAGGAQPRQDRPAPQDMAALVSDYYASLPPDRFPNLIAVASELTTADMDERFELLLDLLVAGLATRSSSAPAANA